MYDRMNIMAVVLLLPAEKKYRDRKLCAYAYCDKLKDKLLEVQLFVSTTNKLWLFL